ncbi:MAG: prepilin-type N-terminal cleavage/methylation domain-containing protein, partial [Candidatus Manganitrophaceae bacterium]
MFQISFNQKGFTLIELTFSMAIMLTVATASYILLTTFHHHYRLQEAMAEMQQQARVSEDLIFREVLQTGYDPTGNLFEPLLNKKTRGTSRVGCDTTLPKGAEPILEATPVAFHFLTDLNENGSVDQGVDIDEDIRYEWVGESGIDSCGIKKAPFTLYRDTGGGAHGQEVSVNVDEFVLTYFDEKGGSFPPVALTSEARAG